MSIFDLDQCYLKFVGSIDLDQDCSEFSENILIWINGLFANHTKVKNRRFYSRQACNKEEY